MPIFLDQFPFREDPVEAARTSINTIRAIDAALDRIDLDALRDAQSRQDALAAQRVLAELLLDPLRRGPRDERGRRRKSANPTASQVSGRLIGVALVVLVVVAMALDTTYKDPDDHAPAAARLRPAAIRRGDLPEGGLDARGERAAPAQARGRAREGRGRGRRAVRQPRGQ